VSTEWLGVAETAQAIASGEVKALAVVDRFLERIRAHDKDIGSYLHLSAEAARSAASAIDYMRESGATLPPLAGVPISLKDVIVTNGTPTTAASKILEGWIPPYDAHVVEQLRLAGAVLLGKVNCDEFAMGSSNERSAYHPTKNPWDLERVPGGSSGGSAASVAAGFCAASLGTDTGGSIRQPAAFCGVTGIKPTYGRVSRYGIVAFASSLDQVGPIARSVKDCALLLETICGFDDRDSTSLEVPVPKFSDALVGDVNGLRVGLPKEYFGEGIDADVRAAVDTSVAALKDRGATIVDVSLPHTHLALAAYYIVAPAEASSNLSRYDGIRFGRAASGVKDLMDLYMRSRGEGFGPEVKRRIMLGTYALRSGYYDAFYKKAQQVRALIKRDFDEAFTQCDLIATPVTPTAAYKIGSKSTPIDMYLGDIFTLSCNLAGLPGMSVPCGFTSEGLPVGTQLLGKPLDEATLLRAGHVIEQAVGITTRPKGFA